MKKKFSDKRQLEKWCRWTARILGTSFLLTFLTIAICGVIGDGPLDLSEVPLADRFGFLAMFGMCLGIVVGWKWEGIGSALILCNFAFFWIAKQMAPMINLAFGSLLLSGILYFIAWLLKRRDT